MTEHSRKKSGQRDGDRTQTEHLSETFLFAWGRKKKCCRDRKESGGERLLWGGGRGEGLSGFHKCPKKEGKVLARRQKKDLPFTKCRKKS